jgi:hypothetical protein
MLHPRQFPAGQGVPQSDRIVHAAGGQLGAIRAERYNVNKLTVVCHSSHRFSRSEDVIGLEKPIGRIRESSFKRSDIMVWPPEFPQTTLPFVVIQLPMSKVRNVTVT